MKSFKSFTCDTPWIDLLKVLEFATWKHQNLLYLVLLIIFRHPLWTAYLLQIHAANVGNNYYKYMITFEISWTFKSKSINKKCKSAYTGKAKEPALLSDRVDSDNVFSSVLSSVAAMTLMSSLSPSTSLAHNFLLDLILLFSSSYKNRTLNKERR